MNKEKLVAEARKVGRALNLAEENGDIDHFMAKDVRYLIECINKLDEPVKPVIPQFVADWIEKAKDEHSISWLMNYENIKHHSYELTLWCFESGNDDNLEKMAKAYLFGYRVEKEKNYEVIIGEGTLGGHPSLVVLYKSIVGVMVLKEMTVADYEDSKRRVPTSFWLTEKEIKDYEKRYWAFAG